MHTERQITFTRSGRVTPTTAPTWREKNWAIVRTVVGYHRYDTAAELVLLNKIWLLQSQMTNYFCPQQKLLSKVRRGPKVTKTYDTAATPYPRAEGHHSVVAEDKAILADTHIGLNPAAIQRQIQALTAQTDPDHQQGRTGRQARQPGDRKARIRR